MSSAEEAMRLDTRVADAFRRLSECGALPEWREGQVEMAVQTARAIDERSHLIVRAGTGVGKTFAYLIPAIASGSTVVVATATRMLQEQLSARDLPRLQEALDRPFTWAVLKGRTNYLCLQRATELRTSTPDDTGDAECHASILEWAGTTTTGDRDELPVEPPEEVWREFSTRSDECPGKNRCPHGSACFAEKARDRATEVDVVVTNHHVYAAGLFASHQILPPHDVAIFDEGHRLDETFRQASATRVDPVMLIYRVRSEKAHAENVEGLIEEAVSQLSELREQLAPLAGRVVPAFPDHLHETLIQATERLAQHAKRLRDAARDTGSQQLLRLAQSAGLVLENLSLSTDQERVAWVEGTDARPILRTIERSPTKLAAFEDPSRRVAILTSAAVGARLAREVGLVPAPASVNVPSPFDYARQAVLYCAKDLPDPRAADWAPAAYERLAQLIRSAGGRTLALFTSWRAVNEAVDRIRPLVDVELLVQGTLGRRELVERFRSNAESCLFGTIGLAEGVDVPGASLNLVTLDRLPFPPMGDPYYAARRLTKDGDAFRQVDLRYAAILFSQISGRLIRTRDDRGVFAVLDPRLATARYGPDLLRALPAMTRETDLAATCALLAECHTVASAAPLTAVA